ncbi:hypothetical protein H5P36_06940 [Bacillus sp. APMAM]|nr:hypothetical protein [Bacillus sp. APMAM]RTZ56615.1 hypothetical protein EKO25_06595 [Bacillus sp. SAJ1]
MRKSIFLVILSVLIGFNMLFVNPIASNAASAGLAWGPKTIGNLKFYLTNVHIGYAGPKFQNHAHVNFHIDKKKSSGKWGQVANYHIVKYSKSGKSCVYIYDSVKKKVVIDQCNNSWKTTADKAVNAMKSFVKTVLDNANWIATLAVWAIITAVIVYVVVPGAVLILAENPPVVTDSTTDNTPLYIESDYITEPQVEYPTSAYDQVDLGDISPDDVSDIDGDASTTNLPELPTIYLEDAGQTGDNENPTNPPTSSDEESTLDPINPPVQVTPTNPSTPPGGINLPTDPTKKEE